jgi:hypothetical protein
LREALSAAGLTQAIDLSALSLQERARLVGARIISPALLQAQAHRWALLNADGSVVAASTRKTTCGCKSPARGGSLTACSAS